MRHDNDDLEAEEGTSALSPPSSAFSSPVRAPFVRSRANSEPFSLNMLNGIAPKARTVFQKKRRNSENIGLKPAGIGAMFAISGLITTSQEKRRDIVRAIDEDDDEELRALCIGAEFLTIAAEFTIEIQSPAKLMKILDMATAQGICYPERQLVNQEGEGLLHMAALEGSCLCIELLINKYDFSPNKWNKDQDETPMHAAASEGQLEALKMLRDHGGNLNCGIQEGKSVLSLAVRSNQERVVEYLLESRVDIVGRGFAETPLHVAAEANHHECARLLIEHGCPVGHGRGEEHRETALHVAAANDAHETICLLLKHSADPNAKTQSGGVRPLHLASKNHSIPCMEAIIRGGGAIDAVDADSRPPLHYAVNSNIKGGSAAIRFLAKGGANLDMRDSSGNTALHLAAVNKRLNRVRTLIRVGADLCLLNNSGKSALSFVLKHQPSCIKELEERFDTGVQVDWITEDNGDDEQQGQGQGDVTYNDLVKMDFGIIIPRNDGLTQTFTTDISMFRELLEICANDTGRLERILMHPLSMTFLHFKWQQMRILYYFLLFCHIIFSFTYTAYVVLVYNIICQPLDVFPAENVSKTKPWGRFLTAECALTDENMVKWEFAKALWVILVLFNVMYTIKEITKIFQSGTKYFREWESILNFLMILSFFFIILPDMFSPTMVNGTDQNIRGTVTITTWQYHIAAIGIFITWIINMLMVGKIPKFGKYVQMLKTVGANFFSFFVAYSSLVMAFALSFNVLFPEEEAFGFFITSFIKTLVMMTGELEYNDLYYPKSEKIDLNGTYMIQRSKMDSNLNMTSNIGSVGDVEIIEETRNQIFPFTPHVLLALFVALVSIVIMNLLFGIAVSDVQDIHKKSKLLQSEQQVHVIDYMENMTRRTFFQHLPNYIKKFIMRKISGFEGPRKNAFEVEIDSYDKKKQLPPYLNSAIKNLVLRMQDKKRGQPTLHGLMKMQLRTDKRLENVMKLLEQLAKANGIRQPSPTPSAVSLELDPITLRRSDSTDSGLTLAVPSSPRLSLTMPPNTLELIREEEE